MAEVSTVDRRRGPRGNLAAHIMAFLALVIAIIAWIVAAGGAHTANTATSTANHAVSVARDAQNTANNSHPNANTQAAPTGAAGTGQNNPIPAAGTPYPNGNGQ